MEFTAPAPQHFFKPLLPGFIHEFLIPDAFFQHHFDAFESRCVIIKTISGKNWPITMIGRRFADGWPEFVSGHDLQVGDFLVFELHGDVFYVKIFGRSGCERLYPPLDVEESDSLESAESSEDEYIAESDDEKFSGKSSEDSMASFEGTVTSLNVLHIPNLFAEMNDLNNRCCKMVLIGEGGRSWPVKISSGKGGETFIRSGWHQFCQSNSLKVGDVFTFEMIDDGSHPIASISRITADIENNPQAKVAHVEDASESNENFSVGSQDILPSFEGIVYSPTSLYIPKSFAEVNGLSNRRCKMVLTAGGGSCWIVKMECGRNGETLIRRGWARFCHSNSLSMGDRFVFELIDNGAQPIASILYNSKRFVNPDTKTERYVATIYSHSIKCSRLYVPKRFSEVHHINNQLCPIVLRNSAGRSWPAFLGFQRSNNQVYIGRGWDKFRDANGFKVGDTVMVELVMKKPELVIKICRLRRSGHMPESGTYAFGKIPKECCIVSASNPHRKGSQLRFPAYFTKENNLRDEIGKDVILRNEKGGSWLGTMMNKGNAVHVAAAWKRFAVANMVKHRDTLMLKVMREGGVLCVNIRGLSTTEIDQAVSQGAVPQGFRM